MPRRDRPGMQSMTGVEDSVTRRAIDALNDVVGRMTSSSGLTKLKPLEVRALENLAPAATQAETSARVNEIARAVNLLIKAHNAAISRLQED